jgi:hypothetical protein
MRNRQFRKLGIASPNHLQHHPCMTPALPDEAIQRIREALQRSNKIEAIKVYREHHPTGLAEAKQAVEQMEGMLFATDPAWGMRRTPSRRSQILALIGHSLAALMFGMRATNSPRVPGSEPAQWYNSPYFLWAFCLFFAGLALSSASALWSARRKH